VNGTTAKVRSMPPDDRDAHPRDGLTYTVSESADDQIQIQNARAAFLDFFQAEYEGVIAFLIKYGAIHQDAEDAAQDAFVDAWSLTTQPGAWERIARPRGWIRVVALRKYHRPTGQRRRMPGILVAEVPENPRGITSVAHDELTVETEFVRSILRDLAADVRAALVFHMDGFSSVEIAHQLGMTDQRVRDLIKTGRRILRTGLVVLREGDRRREL
jgi:RNA polymerase sigma factor (sigma-70 family)